MDYRTPAGQKAMKEASEAHDKWFREVATPEERRAFLDKIEGQYWDSPEGIEKPESVKKAEEEAGESGKG